MDKETVLEFKHMLEQERDTITRELSFIAKPDPEMKGDWNAQYPQFEARESGSHASLEEEEDEVEEYEMRLSAEHTLETRLLQIARALERIEHETYGVCTACGKTISAERLKANPATEFDNEHKKT